MRVNEALDPGTLRHPVTIQVNTPTRDASGGVIDGWSTYATVRAAISTTGGREFYWARQTNSELTHEVTIYRVEGVTAGMRVLWGTRSFLIVAVLEDESRIVNKTVMQCKEING